MRQQCMHVPYRLHTWHHWYSPEIVTKASENLPAISPKLLCEGSMTLLWLTVWEASDHQKVSCWQILYNLIKALLKIYSIYHKYELWSPISLNQIENSATNCTHCKVRGSARQFSLFQNKIICNLCPFFFFFTFQPTEQLSTLRIQQEESIISR